MSIDKAKGIIFGFDYTKTVLRGANTNDDSDSVACIAGGISGAYLGIEAIPGKLIKNIEKAIVRAVNDTKDNDTIGAIVGVAVGAFHGKSSIPKRWIDNLTGRTADVDDGRIFELLDQAAMQLL